MLSCPYPDHLVRHWQAPDGQHITLRPIHPADAGMAHDFVRNLSAVSRYNRFMEDRKELHPALLQRFTHTDYRREMALIATLRAPKKEAETQIGEARYAPHPDKGSVEFALAVADAWQGKGLGKTLMSHLIACARSQGYRRMAGDVLAGNLPMFRLLTALDFSIAPHTREHAVQRVLLML